MNSAVIGVGSNINPEENVRKAEQEIVLLGKYIRRSGFIYTKPLGYEQQDDFLNGVFHIETQLDYEKLKASLKEIEKKLGRVKTINKYGPRTIDLDPVIFNHQIRDPDVFTRDFIRVPVIELLPELSDTIACPNYSTNFEAVKGNIDKILSLLSEPPVSIFGAGKWFCDTDSPSDIIDIYALIESKVTGLEEAINREIIRSGLGKIGSSQVNVRLCLPEDIECPAAKNEHGAESPAFPGSLARKFPGFRLLYMNPG